MIKNINFKNKLIYVLSAAMVMTGVAGPAAVNAQLQEEMVMADTAVAEEIDEISETDEEYGIVFHNLDPVPYVPEELISEESGVVGADGVAVTASSVKYIPVGHFSDPEHKNYQTSAKQQSIKSGTENGVRKYVNETCWAFATMGAMEASYNKNHNIYNAGINNKSLESKNGAIDLSERQLVYFTYFNDNATARDPLGTLEKDNNYLYIGGTSLSTSKKATLAEAFALGGSPAYAFDTVAMGIGPVSENAVPYSTEEEPEYNLQAVDRAYKFDTPYEMKAGRVFDMSQHALVKQMVLDYGSVSTSIYYDSKYLTTISGNDLQSMHFSTEFNNQYDSVKEPDKYKEDNKRITNLDNALLTSDDASVYFHHPSNAANHQVLIVGWDDDIPADRFKNGVHTEGAESNGGWLCKCSYGNAVSRKLAGTSRQWAYDDGYFWVSYDSTDMVLADGAVRRGFTFDMDEKETEDVAYQHTYQYDGSAFSKEISAGSAYANVFSVDSVAPGQTEYLRSVMVKLATPGSVYSVELFGNPNPDNPADGTPILAAPVWGKVDAAGYYDVKLGKGISVSQYDTVSVVVRLYRATLADSMPAIYSGVSGSYTMTVATNKVLKGSDEKAKTVQAMLYCVNSTKKGHSMIFTEANQQWEDMYKNADSLNVKGNVRIKLKTVTKLTEEQRVDPDYTVVDHYVKKQKPVVNTVQPRIEIDPTEIESGSTILYIGQTAVISMKGAAGAGWTSKKPKVATVDDSGLITGIKKGTAELVGIGANGETCTHKIRVRKPSFVSNQEIVQVTVSGQLSINGNFGDIQWMSTKPDIVSVDENTGVYHAKKSGSAVIAAQVGPTKLKCKIKVAKPVLKEKMITLAPEAPERIINFTNKKIDKKQVTYDIDNESVVSVDSATGTLRAVGNGRALVTVHVLDTIVKCKVIVQGM